MIRVILSGIVKEQPVIRDRPEGSPVAFFPVECELKADTKKTEVTVVAAKTLAEKCEKTIKKGFFVMIEGTPTKWFKGGNGSNNDFMVMGETIKIIHTKPQEKTL